MSLKEPKAPTSLHEVLAAESTRSAAATLVIAETNKKFSDGKLFKGTIRTLTLFKEPEGGPAVKAAAESAESQVEPIVTSVAAELDYALNLWARAEDVRATKNLTNTVAKADIVLEDGTVIETDVPVDELMGLEARLKDLKPTLALAPVVDPTEEWTPSSKWNVPGLLQTAARLTLKTEKITEPFVLYEATDKHPAQVKETVRTPNIGQFATTRYASALTVQQKANLLTQIDELIAACRAARVRANSVEILPSSVGTKIIACLMGALNK